ncbi:MAG: phosphatase PAP2 family protein [Saprospiraceae bacterium]|nr:phosphatase PAP2 family protein [Saprospiraceae bacterium]
MQQVFSQHRLWIILFGSFWLIGLAIWFITDHGQELVWLTGWRTERLAQLLSYWTKIVEFPAYVLALLWFLYTDRQYTIILIMVSVMVPLLSFGLKALFAHERPWDFYTRTEQLDQLLWIDGADVLRGLNGFPSGHSLSAFALFGLLALIYYKRTWFVLVCFFMASGVAISRMYLGHHFLKDVLFGSLMGFLLSAVVIGFIHPRIQRAWSSRGHSPRGRSTTKNP